MKDYQIIVFNDNEVYEVYEIYTDTLAAACQRAMQRAIASVSYNVDADILEQKFYDDCAEAEVLTVDLHYMTDNRYFLFAREFEEKDEDLM